MPPVLDARTAIDHFPGIGRYVVNLAQELARLEPDLVLIHNPAAPARRLSLPALPRIACTASPFSIQQQWQVPALLRQAHATLYHSAYYLMPYWPGIPTVLTYYDLIPRLYPEYFTPVQRLIWNVTNRLALATARAVVAISECARADVISHFHVPASRVKVTPLAAGDHFRPQPPERIQAARAKYKLPERYVIYLASNKPHKNLPRLIQAWAQISNNILVIAGHWDERYPQARQIVEKLGLGDRVIFAGPVSDADLPALYSGAALFAFPSLYEGFGLPVLEAMACGAPVVCSSTSSLPEVAGDAALTFDPTDVEAIAAALQQALADADLRAGLRQRGLEQAARFTWARTAALTHEVYRSLG